ncbi:MAG: ATP-binding cassette domain-containing protein, partial [Gemmatimonadales bacterium]
MALDHSLARLEPPPSAATAPRAPARYETPGPAPSADDTLVRIESRRLTALFGRTVALREVSLFVPANTVTAIIGPSGCGKSTFLRCLNRMHELSDGGWVTGSVLLDGEDIYGGTIDPVAVRRRIGMVFQRPTPVPTMSIFD